MLNVLIMAGGNGERFWPLSTRVKPKQLLRLISENSMIRDTVNRILPIIPAERIFVGTNQVQAVNIRAELPDLPKDNIIIEPMFKDTAAAIGYGSLVIERYYPNATVVVLASDHAIDDEANFREMILRAAEVAKTGSIVTLGIRPTHAETGYGYIRVENPVIGVPSAIQGFLEKPSLEKATQYYSSGKYLWNAGIFIFQTRIIFAALEIHSPKLYRLLMAMKPYVEAKTEMELSDAVVPLFAQIDKISIDFAVMEKASNIQVIPVDFGWNDVGGYSALKSVFPLDENANLVKDAKLYSIDSHDNIIIGTSSKRIAIIGVDHLIIVENGDNILICKESESQNIKKIVNMI
jgi:mannose-1-phosphate guanylyltransferase